MVLIEVNSREIKEVKEISVYSLNSLTSLNSLNSLYCVSKLIAKKFLSLCYEIKKDDFSDIGGFCLSGGVGAGAWH